MAELGLAERFDQTHPQDTLVCTHSNNYIHWTFVTKMSDPPPEAPQMLDSMYKKRWDRSEYVAPVSWEEQLLAQWEQEDARVCASHFRICASKADTNHLILLQSATLDEYERFRAAHKPKISLPPPRQPNEGQPPPADVVVVVRKVATGTCSFVHACDCVRVSGLGSRALEGESCPF